MSAASDLLGQKRRRLAARLLDGIERRTGITPAGLTLLAFCAAGFGVGRLLASRALYLLVYGALATLGVAWMLGRRSLSVEVARSELPTRVREGQLVDGTLTVRAERRLTTVILEEELPAGSGPPRRVAVPVLSAGEELTHSYTFVPRLRGVYEIGPLVAEWSDPFGLTKRRATLLEAVDLIVHPTVEPVNDRIVSRAWEDPPIRPPVSKPWPTGFEFYGMRDYVHGDDPRRIVWRAVARSLDPTVGDTRYLVWEAEQGITDEVNLVLDTHTTRHSSGTRSATFETAVRTAASLGMLHLDSGFSVDLHTNSGTAASNVRGRRKQVILLDRLAEVEREEVPLRKGLERLFLRHNRSRHNVIITPHLDRGTAAHLRLLLEGGTSMLLVIVVDDDTDPMTMHRAGGLGCNVVEITVGSTLTGSFQHVVEGMRR